MRKGRLGLQWLLILFFYLAGPLAAHADQTQDVAIIMQMADYLGVDYPEAVEDGQVVNEAEYAEMQEFSAAIESRIQTLPEEPGKPALLQAAAALREAVAAKAPLARISALTAEISRGLMQHYPVTMAPQQAPDLALGHQLFQAQCASCHGAEGRGDGPAGAGLEPPPTDFHEPVRQDQRSPFALYNTLTLGVEGTAMPSFSQLSEAERWALAYYISQLRYGDAERSQGAALAAQGHPALAALSDLNALSQATPEAVRAQFGEDGVAVLAYLRSQPALVASAQDQDHLSFTSRTLDESLAAYRAGDRARAEQLALTAYLEGFELAEASVSAVDHKLGLAVETEMMRLRQLLRHGAPVDEVAAQIDDIKTMLAQAREELRAGSLSALGSFTGSFIILAREGLEAILVLAAVFAFLRKAERRDALPYVHGGWIAAVVLGIATWFVSTYIITISGASRELTEGITALAAAVILLYVGFWLHSKSYAARWQQYVAGKLQGALETRNLWALTAVSFLAVYREMFETVLFYRALWEQGNHDAILAGGAAAAAFLLAVIWAVYKLSIRLPVRQFFSWSSALIAVLAVIFVGNGVAALQEAGYLSVNPIGRFSLPLLGIHGNVEALAAQLIMLALAIAAFAFNHYSARRLAQ